MRSIDFKFFVAFHKGLNISNYSTDPDFDIRNFTFIQTGSASRVEIDDVFTDFIVQENELPFYNSKLHKLNYFAPATWYHLYKNNLHKNLDYIGLIEYDFVLNSGEFDSLHRQIKNIVENKLKGVWSLSYIHSFSKILSQDIKIDNRNAILQILDDYNNFFGTAFDLFYVVDSFEKFPTQQSFFCDVATFDRIMSFIAYIVENKNLVGLKTYKLPATLLERYFGLAILLNQFNGALNLKHLNQMNWVERRWIFYYLRNIFIKIEFLFDRLAKNLRNFRTSDE